MSPATLKKNLKNQLWRLENLYWIKNENGEKVKFRLNDTQRKLLKGMWYLNIILKARQLGMTTFIQIYILDCCLFFANKTAGIVAQGQQYAEDFFNDKIKFAYDNLPESIKRLRPARTDSARELSFNNGSVIRVGVSLRSGVHQYLHISEFGKICAERPDRAREIVTGALNTVHQGNYIWIESTAEGAHGYFYDMVEEAKGLEHHTKMDYKLHFFPWYEDPKYSLDEHVELNTEATDYFTRLEQKTGIVLTGGQKGWYVKKKASQQDDMFREFPSTPEEAFKAVNRHAIYGPELAKVYKEERICALPYDESLPVHFYYDLGRSKTDSTCIWFGQKKRQQYRFIDFYQNWRKPVSHYYRVIQERGYIMGTFFLPHDGDTNDFDMEDYEDKLRELGAKDVQVVPRIKHINLGIEAVREILPFCYFDETKCDEGLNGLKNYQYQYDEKLATIKSPLHNWASHPADAFRTFAQAVDIENMHWGSYLGTDKQETRRGRKFAPRLGKREIPI